MSANHESVLWVVERLHPNAHWVFRTRTAARNFLKAQTKARRPADLRTMRLETPWIIHRAKWGPDA